MTNTDKPTQAAADRKPRDDELDIYGLTHPGNVRQVNQDHFLMCSLRRALDVHQTSLPDVTALGGTERLAFLAMVADGVGGGNKGGEAARLAVEAVTEYVAEAVRCYYTADATDDDAFMRALEDSAMRCHESIMNRASEDRGLKGMATTLTLWIGVWPRAYLVQVGDSRCYIFHDGVLNQVSRDQTMAEALVEQGVLRRSQAVQSRWAHVLSSAIGGSQTAPSVTRLQQSWDNVGVLCSDGLTKHVTEERIRERLATMTSAKQVCEDLLQEALDGGGSDNITIIVGRAVRREQ